MKKLNQLLLTSIAIIGSASSLISAKLSNENLNGNKSFNDSHNITHDLSDWMSDLNDKKLLSDLNIPGTHDSAMFDCVGAACTFGKWYALTQGANFAEQLKLGIRFFDLRLTRNPELWMAHGVVWANNQNLEKTLDSFVEFLKNHPTEFIIIRVKDENTSVKAEDREWEKYFLNVMKKPKYNDYLFKNSNKNKNANPSVKELRGKILTFNHFHHLITTNADFGPLYRNNNIIFQDLYNLNHENKKVAISDTLNMSNNEINLKTYVNFISRANGEKPWYTAKELNPWLLNYLREHPEIVRLGILPMDFPVENLVSEIIKRNFAVKPKEITRNLFDPIINKNIEITSLQDNTDFVQFSQSAKNFHCNVYLEDELIGSSVIGENLEIKLSKKIKYNQNLKFYFYKLTPHNDFYKETKYNEIHQTMYVQPNLIWMKKLSDYKNFVLKFKDNNAFLDNSVKDIFNFSVNKYIVEELNNLININKAQDSHNEELFASIQNKFQTLNNMYTDWISIFKDLSTIFKNINDNISNKFEKHIQVTNHLSFIWDSIINKFKILNQNLFNDNFNEKNIDFKNQIELVKKILNSFQIKAIENKNVDEIVLDSWNLFNNNIWGIEIYKANLNSIKTQVEDCLLLVLRSNNIEEFNDSISKYNLTRTKLDKYISSTHNFIEQTNQIVNDFTSLSANQIESIKNEFVNTIANLDNEQEKNRFFEKIRNYHIIFNDALSLFNESNILKNKLESLEFSTEETNKFLAKLKEFKENIENNYYLFDNQTKLIQDMSDIKVLMNEVNIKLNDYINQKKQFEKLKTAINNNQFNFKEVYDLIYKYFEKKDSSSE
ncbi:phosphatidylinositol-specific phospholipase C domain-containing protein, partial [[Mycoplasma] anseris]